MAERIYLDNSSATKPFQQAVMAAMPYYEESYGAYSSPHTMGQELLGPVEAAVKELSALFGAGPDDQFAFTNSGAEAINQAIYSAFQEQNRRHGKNHFVARNCDTLPAIEAIKRLEEEGVFLRLAPCSKRGFVTEEAFIESISPRTALVSLSWACGLTGVIQPLEEIAALCKKRAIWLHVDASYVVGKLDVNFATLGVDLLTFEGNSLHAPAGTGGIFAKKEVNLHPLVAGGSINVPLLISLGQAAQLSCEMQSLYCSEVSRLRSLLEEGIVSVYPEAELLFQDEVRLPNVTLIAFPGIHAELLAFALNRKGIFACMGGGPFQPLEKVAEMAGIDPLLARTALSFSLSHDTQEAEIERAIQLIGDVSKRMRRLSQTVWQEAP